MEAPTIYDCIFKKKDGKLILYGDGFAFQDKKKEQPFRLGSWGDILTLKKNHPKHMLKLILMNGDSPVFTLLHNGDLDRLNEDIQERRRHTPTAEMSSESGNDNDNRQEEEEEEEEEDDEFVVEPAPVPPPKNIGMVKTPSGFSSLGEGGGLVVQRGPPYRESVAASSVTPTINYFSRAHDLTVPVDAGLSEHQNLHLHKLQKNTTSIDQSLVWE